MQRFLRVAKGVAKRRRRTTQDIAMRLLDDRYSAGLFLRNITVVCMEVVTRTFPLLRAYLSDNYACPIPILGLIVSFRFYNRNSVLRVPLRLLWLVKRLPGHCTNIIDQNCVIPLFRSFACARQTILQQ